MLNEQIVARQLDTTNIQKKKKKLFKFSVSIWLLYGCTFVLAQNIMNKAKMNKSKEMKNEKAPHESTVESK